MTDAYSDLWVELFDPCWLNESFVAGKGTVSLGKVDTTWSPETPLRSDVDRWLATAELDALVSIALGLSAKQLIQMYRSQFAVLRKYEYASVFDDRGRLVTSAHQNYSFHQQQWENELKAAPTKRGQRKIGMWQRVQAYMAGDTDVDLGPFVPPFTPADREKAMSTAYRAFQARLAEE